MDIDWLKIIEVLGLLFGVAYVVGAILEKKWCWYAGIVATILYAIGVYYYKLYGEFILQFFYLFVSFYGLYLWRKTVKTNSPLEIEIQEELSISFSSAKFILAIILTGSFLSIGLYFLLIYLNSSYPFWDALTSGFGITTTYMTAKKKIENWVFWIVIDIILCIVLYLKGLPFYSSLYVLYTFSAAFGYYTWKKEYQKKSLTI